jgi:hypothetical protein
MKKIWLILWGLAALLAACSEPGQPERVAPAKLLSQQQLASILTEISIAESVVSLSGLSFQDALARYDRYERDILRRNGVDSAAYRQSYRYYMSSSEDMEAIFAAVNDSITKRRDALMRQLDAKGLR